MGCASSLQQPEPTPDATVVVQHHVDVATKQATDSTTNVVVAAQPIPEQTAADAVVVAAQPTSYGEALCDAAMAGDLPRALQLLEDGAPIDSPDAANQRTPLIKAAMKGHTEMVKLLLERGAARTCQDSAGRTAMDWAAKQGHTATVDAFGPDPKGHPKANELSTAALEGDLATVLELLEAGTPIDVPDAANQRTPLIKAAMKGHTEVVKLLLERGASPAYRDSAGRTAKDWAVKQGHAATKEAFSQLLPGSNPAETDPQGMALCTAALEGDVPTVLQLLEAGAPIDFPEYGTKRTPLINAAMKGHTEVVTLLLARGAAPASKDVSGWTALHWATKEGHTATVTSLGGASAEVTAAVEQAAILQQRQDQNLQFHIKAQEDERRARANQVGGMARYHHAEQINESLGM